MLYGAGFEPHGLSTYLRLLASKHYNSGIALFLSKSSSESVNQGPPFFKASEQLARGVIVKKPNVYWSLTFSWQVTNLGLYRNGRGRSQETCRWMGK